MIVPVHAHTHTHIYIYICTTSVDMHFIRKQLHGTRALYTSLHTCITYKSTLMHAWMSTITRAITISQIRHHHPNYTITMPHIIIMPYTTMTPKKSICALNGATRVSPERRRRRPGAPELRPGSRRCQSARPLGLLHILVLWTLGVEPNLDMVYELLSIMWRVGPYLGWA